MTVPVWLVVGTIVVLLVLVAYAAVASLAWWGLGLELAQARKEERLLRIDILGATEPAPARRSQRWAADRRQIQATMSDQGEGQ